MALTAALKVQLLAETLVVAESDDPQLWQSVFAAIHSGKSTVNAKTADSGPSEKEENTKHHEPQPEDGPLAKFARELGIGTEEVVGACAPDREPPFVRLDQRYWEALRNNTGSRGRSSVAPVALAATLLCLWFKHAGLGSPTVRQCQEVLGSINLRDLNPSRSLRNAEWLQARNGNVVVNPAQWSQALRIAKAYCLKTAPKEAE
jgi:hypothetical protein